MTTLFTASDGKEAVDVDADQSSVPASYAEPSTAADLEGSTLHTEPKPDSSTRLNPGQPDEHTHVPPSSELDLVPHQSNKNTVDDLVNLHSLCRLQITRSSASSMTEPHIHNVCKYADRIVAILTSDIPLGVVLPGGISCFAPREDLTISALGNTLQSELPALIPLRYRTVLSVPRSAHRKDEISALLLSTTIITVGRVVLNSNQNIGDIVPENDNNIKFVQLLRGETDTELASDSDLPTAVAFAPCKERRMEIALNVDVMAYVEKSATFQDVLRAITEASCRFVDAAAAIIDHFHPSAIVARHFAVMGGNLALTVVMPDLLESDTVEFRKQIHESFLLPCDRPLFRAACRVLSNPADRAAVFDGGHVGRLSDVHIGIKSHGLGVGTSDVEEHLVQGSYLYCHYLQDRFNDSGWGCAYRSLQTLISWCIAQRYITMRKGMLPSHRDIQRALVEVGDKPEHIVGSKEWIGANEVCYALEKLANVHSKIIHVSRGSEMSLKSRLLARHFEEQGSPVMVGGGVLAWTILGVARNERSGSAKYLILDPHYEGRDDLKTIQSKGWVAWKSVDTFRDDSFYNLCLPQRPNGL